MQFTKALRGYSCEEVDTYLAHVNDRYVALAKECSELKKKMAVVAAGQNEFREEALREKDKIAKEADALLQAKKTEAATLVDEAKRKAARILSDAELAAAGLLKQAEHAAEEIRQKQQDELAAYRETERQLREKNNLADRMVEEIDSFREKVYNMYAGHIESLERLAHITDEFYDAKEKLTADTDVQEQETETDPVENPDAAVDEHFMPSDEHFISTDEHFIPSDEHFIHRDEVADDTPVSEGTAGEDDDFVRIDWQEHRQKHAEKMAGKTLWEIVDEAEAHAASAESEPVPEEPAMDAVEDTWEDAIYAEAAPEPELEPEPEAGPAAEEPAEEPDLLESLEQDLLSAFAPKEEASATVDDPTDLDLEALMGSDAADTAMDPDSEEDFLADIASEYLTPAPATALAEAAKDKETDISATDADDLDALLDDEQSHEVSLTGEFDKIFSSKKSAAYVDEVNRQPLVEATKPEKPKKHK